MITINFAGTNYRLFSRIQTGLTAACVVLVVALALIYWSVSSCRVAIDFTGQRLNEMAAAHEQVKPLLLEREQLAKDLAVMSGLMEARRFSWTKLLTNIEDAVPVGAALFKVDFNPRDRMLVLDGMAQSPEALRNLMVGMERSPAFKDPLLKHQSVDKGSNTFNVVSLYSGDKASGVAKGK